VVCVQNRYGVGAPPEAGEFLRACGEQGIAFVPFFAIAGDARERRPDSNDHDEVTSVAAAHDVTPAQVRLAWTLQQGPHVLAIPGTGNPDHLAANVAAAALRLSPPKWPASTPPPDPGSPDPGSIRVPPSASGRPPPQPPRPREVHPHLEASTRQRPGVHPSVVRGRDRLHDRQPQAGAASLPTRSSPSRWNGSNSRVTCSGGTAGPLLATVSTAGRR